MKTVQQAQREASRTPILPPATFSHFMLEITRLAKGDEALPKTARRRLKAGSHGHRVVTERGHWRKNLTTDTASGYTNRRDWQAKAMGDFGTTAFATNAAAATASSSTTLTNSGASFPTAGQGLAGKMVAVGPNASGTGSVVFGIIVSNTGTVLTVDQWYDPTSTTGAAGTTPNATGKYCILPGQAPAPWLAVTSDATSPTSADTTLASEATTNGFARAIGSYSHTAAATTYALAKTFTATGSLTINTEAVFGACNPTGGGVMPFKSAETSPPALISGDTCAQTVTVTIN